MRHTGIREVITEKEKREREGEGGKREIGEQRKREEGGKE